MRRHGQCQRRRWQRWTQAGPDGLPIPALRLMQGFVKAHVRPVSPVMEQELSGTGTFPRTMAGRGRWDPVSNTAEVRVLSTAPVGNAMRGMVAVRSAPGPTKAHQRATAWQAPWPQIANLWRDGATTGHAQPTISLVAPDGAGAERRVRGFKAPGRFPPSGSAFVLTRTIPARTLARRKGIEPRLEGIKPRLEEQNRPPSGRNRSRRGNRYFPRSRRTTGGIGFGGYRGL